MTTRDGLIERVEAAATTFERDQATFAKIAGLVVLWYLPWNAAKAALWEVASGDRAFTPEAVLDLIRAALSDPSDQTDADLSATNSEGGAERSGGAPTIEDRVAALEAVAHPPIDLEPAIVEILAERGLVRADLPSPQGATWPDDVAVERAAAVIDPIAFETAFDGHSRWSVLRSRLLDTARAVLLAAGPPPSPEPVTDGEVEAVTTHVLSVDGFAVSTRAVRAALTAFLALRLGRV